MEGSEGRKGPHAPSFKVRAACVAARYVRHVRNFAAFLGRSPDTATSEDVRRFQLHMATERIGAPATQEAQMERRTILQSCASVAPPLRRHSEPQSLLALAP
jgi:hypothetical protein